MRLAMNPDIHQFYGIQSPLSSPGRHAALFDALPSDAAGINRTVQGLLIHEHVAKDFYGVDLTEKRRAESHIRPVEKIVDAILALDSHPLSLARAPEKRLAGICRHFALLAVTMFRARGIPARMRCGFGTYFNPPFFEDHVVCEYWKAAQNRWVLVDPQFDAVWLKHFDLDHDILDVPRDRFLVSAEAWRRCRNGDAAPARFGIAFHDLRGLWFVAGSLVREVAALNKHELLPWDMWGAQPGINASLDAGALAFFDRLAELAIAPDENFGELRKVYAGDDRLRLTGTVYNAQRRRDETVLAA
jgi:hypothetical protein